MILKTRKNICGQSLYRSVKASLSKKFPTLPKDTKKSLPIPIDRKKEISTIDCLMSSIALFGLKFPSLLQYDQKRRIPRIDRNLRSLFGVYKTPCDTYMRECLDEVEVQDIRNPFKNIFTQLQRGKALESYVYLDDNYLVSLDGTGHFSSSAIHCENCCVKESKTGQKTYYHQMLAAVLIHPDHRQVIPLAPEPILKQDGGSKNDCERNAAKRLLGHIRREHPHLPLIIVEDSLASNGPHIKDLQKHDMRYILGVKPGDHNFLFDWVKDLELLHHEYKDAHGTQHIFSFTNGVPLNDTYHKLSVNFLEYWEIDKKGNKHHFSWVTDIFLTQENVKQIMKGGRARWHIENNTFNTLKNQGYNFEHNYGHGYKNLCTVMGFMMMLAFLIDQAQELTCMVFKKARALTGRYSALWESIRAVFLFFDLKDWNELFFKIIEEHTIPDPNSS